MGEVVRASAYSTTSSSFVAQSSTPIEGRSWGFFEEERRFFGKEPFAQGLQENHDVASLIPFAAEQGMLARPLAVDELFTENTRGT
jgi:hypothetical protein